MANQFIFIARHGLTLGNEAQTVQGFNDPLSTRGHAQAVRLAERAKQLTFDHLLASDMPRAAETAAYIAEATGKSVVSSELLREVIQDDGLIGLPKDTENVQAFLDAEKANLHNPEWRFGTAESFSDTRARALKALELFASYGEEKLFVVSHGQFIRYIVATVLLGLRLTPEAWLPMSAAIRTHNTGITILKRNVETGEWVIYCVNDHAHFADN